MMPENQAASPILALALQTIISRRLQKALNSQEFILFPPILPNKFDKAAGDSPQDQESAGLKTGLCPEIRLKRIQTADPLQYAAAVALQLAHSPSEAVSLAAVLKHHLFQSIQSVPTQNPADQIWHYCRVSVDLRGWIYLELSDIGLAIWLEVLRSFALEAGLSSIALSTDGDNVNGYTRSNQFSPALFQQPQEQLQEKPQEKPQEQPQAELAATDLLTVLYTHARCCSLLDRNRLSIAVLPHWLIGGELRCNQPAERQLIAEFCDALDYLNSPARSAPAALKIALRLSQAFEAFYATCRLSWPESAPAAVLEPNLLAVRLGLIAIGQKLLQILLEQRLFVSAPTQL